MSEKSPTNTTNKKKQIKVGTIHINYSEVNENIQEDAISQATNAVATFMKGIFYFKLIYLGEYQHYWQIAKFMKEYFDKTYSGSWHVIVGESFGSAITNEVSKYIN